MCGGRGGGYTSTLVEVILGAWGLLGISLWWVALGWLLVYLWWWILGWVTLRRTSIVLRRTSRDCNNNVLVRRKRMVLVNSTRFQFTSLLGNGAWLAPAVDAAILTSITLNTEFASHLATIGGTQDALEASEDCESIPSNCTLSTITQSCSFSVSTNLNTRYEERTKARFTIIEATTKTLSPLSLVVMVMEFFVFRH